MRKLLLAVIAGLAAASLASAGAGSYTYGVQLRAPSLALNQLAGLPGKVFDVSVAGVSKLAVSGAGAISAADLYATGLSVVPTTRPATAYVYYSGISGDLLTGGANTKTYTLGLLMNRPVGFAATGDSNDALLRASANNYAVNDANYILRGINVSMANRSGGVVGKLDNALGVQGKSGGTASALVGLSVTSENYGTVSSELGGIDVLLKNEGAVATSEYGVKVRNLNNSIATKVGAAFKVEDTGANDGFTTGLDMSAATLTNQIVFSNGMTVTVGTATVVFTNLAGSSVTLQLLP